MKLSPFIFKPSKQFIFSSKAKTKIIDFQPYKLSSTPKSQKLFSTITPVRHFNRFIKQKKANTGVDPIQTFINFVNKDLPKPYKSQLFPLSKENRKNDIHIETNKWSIGTTCNCIRKEFLPKIDPYKDYHFITKKENININKLRMTYLSTDHISIKTPDMLKTIDTIRNNDNRKSILKLKELNFNNKSNSFWVPFEHHNNNYNRSSVNYNILNYKNNDVSGKRESTITEKSINNKKKGITEILILQKNFVPRFRPEYAEMLKENSKRFMKYKGSFTQLYDSYNRNGNVYQPFTKSNSSQKLNNKKNNLSIII